MKRSEAVIQMTRFYNIKNCMVESGHITCEDFCSQMLELLEDLGIYPPDIFIEGYDCTMWSPE